MMPNNDQLSKPCVCACFLFRTGNTCSDVITTTRWIPTVSTDQQTWVALTQKSSRTRRTSRRSATKSLYIKIQQRQVYERKASELFNSLPVWFPGIALLRHLGQHGTPLRSHSNPLLRSALALPGAAAQRAAPREGLVPRVSSAATCQVTAGLSFCALNHVAILLQLHAMLVMGMLLMDRHRQ